MGYQISQPEMSSADSVSLEKRFGVEDGENKTEINTENASEKKIEKIAEEGVVEKDVAYRSALSNLQTQTDDDADVMQDASSVHQQMDRESQITHLIDLATQKGVRHAVKVAQKTQDYYVLDQLHDRLLTEELHEVLESRGFIKEE
jgi:glucose dehydrogenase